MWVATEAVTAIPRTDAYSVAASVICTQRLSWTSDLLPALRDAGVEFDELEASCFSQDMIVDTFINLVGFFASTYKDGFKTS